MSGFAVDADQGRIGPVIVGLQGSGKLEWVGGDYPVVMVGSGYQSCRIFCARFQVVQWRVTSEVFEHLLAVFTGAVIAGPVPADGKLVVAEHIHHTHLRDGYAEEVGTLRHTGAY